MATATPAPGEQASVHDPPFAHALFGSTRWAWVWLAVRLYLAYEWLTAAWEKMTNPAWYATGLALKGFWTGAIATSNAAGAHPTIGFRWYQTFLQYMLDQGWYVWFAKLVIAGELIAGIGLLLGAFTGISAFLGGFMNWNFMMAGAASINPVLFTLSILVILAWKSAGWIGLDRWLLPRLGTPWEPGSAWRRRNGARPL